MGFSLKLNERERSRKSYEISNMQSKRKKEQSTGALVHVAPTAHINRRHRRPMTSNLQSNFKGSADQRQGHRILNNNVVFGTDESNQQFIRYNHPSNNYISMSKSPDHDQNRVKIQDEKANEVKS